MIVEQGVGHANSSGKISYWLCLLNMILLLQIFQQKDNYKTCWMHSTSKYFQLIYSIIVRHTDRKDVQITRAMHGAKCWSEHRLLMEKAGLLVHPPTQRQRSNKKRLNCVVLDNFKLMNQMTSTTPWLKMLLAHDPSWTLITSKMNYEPPFAQYWWTNSQYHWL